MRAIFAGVRETLQVWWDNPGSEYQEPTLNTPARQQRSDGTPSSLSSYFIFITLTMG